MRRATASTFIWSVSRIGGGGGRAAGGGGVQAVVATTSVMSGRTPENGASRVPDLRERSSPEACEQSAQRSRSKPGLTQAARTRRVAKACTSSRAGALPDGLDTEHIHAEMKDGVLTIALPKKAAAQTKSITVKSGEQSKS
jgi:hypothetical protein